MQVSKGLKDFYKKGNLFYWQQTQLVSVFNPLSLFDSGEQGVLLEARPVANITTWRRNLLTYTEDFSNAAWNRSEGAGTTLGAKTTAPDGTNTAQLVTFGGLYSSINQTVSYSNLSGDQFSTSVWIKRVSGNTVYHLRAANSGSQIGSPITITDSWAKYSLSQIMDANNQASVFSLQDRNASGFGTVAIWHPQTEKSTVVTEYQPILSTGDAAINAAFPQNALYQDSVGTTPVTAAGQPVGLWLDKSKGLALGSELLTNGDFSNGATGWTAINGASLDASSGALVITSNNASYGSANSPNIPTVAGRTYTFSVNISALVNTQVHAPTGGSVVLPNAVRNGVYTGVFTATSSTSTISLLCFATAGNSATFDNVSVKELAGNHFTQPTAGKRPMYVRFPAGGTRNLLTYTEDFSNARWTKGNTTLGASTTAPDGSSTAQLVSFGGQYANIGQTFGYSNLTGDVFSSGVWIKRVSGNTAYHLNSIDGVGLPITITDAWAKYSVSQTMLSNSVGSVIQIQDRNASGFGTIAIWHPQLERGSTATAYQKVVSSADVTEAGVADVWAVKGDGVDDFMSSAAIDFTATDKITGFIGVRKLDNTGRIVLEMSTNAISGRAIYLSAGADVVDGYSLLSSGTTFVTTGVTAPVVSSDVVTLKTDIAQPLASISRNAGTPSANTGTQGTGNFGNHALYLLSRAGTGLFFNGPVSSLIVRGAATDAAGIAKGEKWTAQRIGVTLP